MQDYVNYMNEWRLCANDNHGDKCFFEKCGKHNRIVPTCHISTWDVSPDLTSQRWTWPDGLF